MRTRLQAEERLRAINDGAVAAGTVDKAVTKAVVRQLERTAVGEQRPRAAKASAPALAQMGVGVRKAPASKNHV